jgi:carbon starvation protein
LVWLLAGYGFLASVLPVDALVPRGYLSTFMKLGVVFWDSASSRWRRPSNASHDDVCGRRRPDHSWHRILFLFITIACGAVSGFHALVSSAPAEND